MSKKMIKLTNTQGSAYMVSNRFDAKQLAEDFRKISPELSVEVFEGHLKFEQLPEDIQADVKSTLRVFDRVSVYYENGRFWVSTGAVIKAEYASDHYVCGEYKQNEIYTPEEIKQIYKEEFGG